MQAFREYFICKFNFFFIEIEAPLLYRFFFIFIYICSVYRLFFMVYCYWYRYVVSGIFFSFYIYLLFFFILIFLWHHRHHVSLEFHSHDNILRCVCCFRHWSDSASNEQMFSVLLRLRENINANISNKTFWMYAHLPRFLIVDLFLFLSYDDVQWLKML